MVKIWNDHVSSLQFYDEVTETLKIVKGPEAWYTPLHWQKWILLYIPGPFDTVAFFCRQYICFNNIYYFDYSTYQINIYITHFFVMLNWRYMLGCYMGIFLHPSCMFYELITGWISEPSIDNINPFLFNIGIINTEFRAHPCIW